MGSSEDWDAGRGSLYYIEDKNGEKAMPVFTTTERVERFIQANFNNPEAHMQMFESLPVSHIKPLTEGRFIVMPLEWEGVARAALTVGVDYVVRVPRPGREQEILRIPK